MSRRSSYILLFLLLQTSISLGFHPKMKTDQKTHEQGRALPESDSESKIIGGRMVKTREYPFAVHIYTMVLEKQVGIECGGSIMTETRILTACHCLASIRDDQPPRMYDSDTCVVSAGSSRKQDNRKGQLRKVESFSIHPLCVRTPWRFLSHDLGIVHLSKDHAFDFNPFVQPMNIPTRREKEFLMFIKRLKRARTECSVIGWGVHTMTINETNPTDPISYSGPSKFLRVTTMALISDKICENKFCTLSRKIDSMHDMCDYKAKDVDQICADAVKERETDCQGDSGGPLICQGYVVGVVSSGFECGLLVPNVYASIARSLKWLGLSGSTHTIAVKGDTSKALLAGQKVRNDKGKHKVKAMGTTIFHCWASIYSVIFYVSAVLFTAY